MICYIAYSAPEVEKLVARAKTADDPEAARVLSRRIEDGASIWKSWTESHGTNAVEAHGSEGVVEVPASYLDEVPAVKEKYEGAVGTKVFVGVGMKLSEAAKALEYAKAASTEICFYTEEMEEALAKLKEKPDPLLTKAAIDAPVAPVPVEKPVATQGDHEEAANVYNLLNEDRPPAPEATHAAADFEAQLHDQASAGEAEDQDQANGHAARLDQVKQQVVQALQALKAQAPVLEQMKAQAPQAYQALTALSQAVIGFARELAPKPMAKSEQGASEEPVELVHHGRVPGLKSIDTQHMGTGARGAEYRQGLPQVGRAYYYRKDSAPEPIVTQGAKAVYRTRLDPGQRLYDLGTDPEGLAGPAREKFLAGRGLNSPADTLLNEIKGRGYYGYHNSASSQPGTVALFYEHPVEEMAKDEMEKKLPMPHAAAHHHVILPPGSVVDDKVKVQHSDGGTGWIEARAGQVRSQDPSGHPVSSLRPNSK